MIAKERIDAETVRIEIDISNRLGLHARAAAKFVEVAGRFTADITVSNDGESVSGKSILGLMMLAAAQGTRLTVVATGADAESALDALAELIVARFHEGA